MAGSVVGFIVLVRLVMKMKNTENMDRNKYLFDNKALTSLIFPLIVEQLLAVLVGLADSIMIASVGKRRCRGYLW